MSIEIADPRAFSATADAQYEPLIRLAEASLSASSTSRAEEFHQKLARALAVRLRAGDAATLANVFSASPSAAVARHLWRGMIDGWRVASEPAAGDRVVATLFALPLVIVVGRTSGDTTSGPDALAASLSDAGPVNALLREHRALGGNLSFSLAEPLVSAETIDVACLPKLLAWQELSSGTVAAERALHPAPMSIHPSQESVHLRFLLGTAIGAPSIDLFGNPSGGEWLMALAQELSRQLASAGASVLALPRPPQAPLLALQHGRAAQREVGAQIFASNAIRRFRAGVGEPSAVISAHRCAAAPEGGELRLSLSSPFDPRQAEGFRCPLFPFDRAGDVATMLVELLHDCRVSDVRVVEGVQADRDSSTGMTLLFKTDAIPDGETVVLH
jgi:hypothetical protein